MITREADKIYSPSGELTEVAPTNNGVAAAGDGVKRGSQRGPTFVSLFAGIGGIDLGLERAGWRCLAQVEIDPFCRAVLAKHWPGVERFNDVRYFPTAGWLEPIDLVAGGFPCQPVSVAGRGRAQRDARWLWPAMYRLVLEIRPRWVLAENVPGLKNRGADIVLRDLEAAGYAAWAVVVGAEHVGAPHRRHRVWIVGLADAVGAPGLCRLPLRERQPAERTAADRAGLGGSGHGLADADRGRQQQPGGVLADERRWAGDCRAAVADAGHGAAQEPQGDDGEHGERQAERRWEQLAAGVGAGGGAGGGRHAGGDGRDTAAAGDACACREVGQSLAFGVGLQSDAEREGLEGLRPEAGEPEVAEHRDGRAPTRWPARPGEPQHRWEQPRLMAYPARRAAGRGQQQQGGGGEAGHRDGGDDALAQRPMGPATDGVPGRLVRATNRSALKAAGNAVVPDVPELIGRWMRGVDAAPAGKAVAS